MYLVQSLPRLIEASVHPEENSRVTSPGFASGSPYRSFYDSVAVEQVIEVNDYYC